MTKNCLAQTILSLIEIIIKTKKLKYNMLKVSKSIRVVAISLGCKASVLAVLRMIKVCYRKIFSAVNLMLTQLAINTMSKMNSFMRYFSPT